MAFKRRSTGLSATLPQRLNADRTRPESRDRSRLSTSPSNHPLCWVGTTVRRRRGTDEPTVPSPSRDVQPCRVACPRAPVCIDSDRWREYGPPPTRQTPRAGKSW